MVWDGNPIKLDCDDHCTSINVLNSLSNKKKKEDSKGLDREAMENTSSNFLPLLSGLQFSW